MIYPGAVHFGRSGEVVMRFEATRATRSLARDGLDFREQVKRLDRYREATRHADERLRQRADDVAAVMRNLGLASLLPHVKAAVPGNAYVINNQAAAVALTGATQKTLFYLNSAAANQPSICELAVGFDGVTASAVSVLMEICFGTKATNSTPGTASTTFTPVQMRGWPAQASAQAAAINCTSEPTVLTRIKPYLVTPYGGLLILQFPLGRELTGIASGTAASGNQVAWTATAPAGVNCRYYGEWDE